MTRGGAAGGGGRGGRKFQARRALIVGVATQILNERGVRGMTLADVAARAGMVTTGIAYYFGRKEALAAACFEAGLERLEALAVEAMAGETAEARVAMFLRGYFALTQRIFHGQEPEIPIFSDIRTLSEPILSLVLQRYRAFFGKVRDLLRTPELAWLRGSAAAARTNIILEQIYWLRAWRGRYDVEDQARLCERMLDVLLNGIAAPGGAWAPEPLDLDDAMTPRLGAAPEALITAAIRQINQHGYKGASVERISAALKRTKGAFYHHIEAKDDLVLAGFERTYDVLKAAQSAALALDADPWVKLHSAAAALAEYQLTPQGPLMRTSALQSLPEALRAPVIERSDRIARRFSGMIADGVAAGVLRPVDPAVASQMLNAAINAVADMRLGDRERAPPEADRFYMAPMLMGLLKRVNV